MQYAGHIWMNEHNLAGINQIWYKIIKAAVGATFNVKQSLCERILWVPPITIQTSINRTKHLLKLNFNQMPKDTLRNYIQLCTSQQISQPAEVKVAIKEAIKFLEWKTEKYPTNFTELDIEIVTNKDVSRFLELSPRACSYNKNSINRYTEKIWLSKIANQWLMEGEGHIPIRKCSRLPVPSNIQRSLEVCTMSLFYPNNLMNSFLYKHTYLVESPLCPQCGVAEETPYHVICECSRNGEEIKEIMRNNISEGEIRLGDCTTLLNCSRDEKFIKICLQVLSDREFRDSVDLG